MGEATHGTSEFAKMKSRFFKYLVTELEFNAIALEADFAASLDVNDYVLNGQGQSYEVLKGLKYFHCVNQETLELIEWIREHNQHVVTNKKLKLYDFDCRSSYKAFERIKKIFFNSRWKLWAIF